MAAPLIVTAKPPVVLLMTMYSRLDDGTSIFRAAVRAPEQRMIAYCAEPVVPEPTCAILVAELVPCVRDNVTLASDVIVCVPATAASK